MRLNTYITYQFLHIVLIRMGMQPLASLAGLRLLSHTDADAIQQPFVRIVEYKLCQVERLRHTDTTMRQGPCFTFESTGGRRVMKVDGIVVLETEHDTA